ncbi:hypothetical protein [Streptosporangium sandarakinum]|uniref:hypothetical protein n=1 Tax=Streptosporangium sandarakinum TaxID=1260955 RepID=UPI00339EFC7D
MLLIELARTSAAVAATPARLAKIAQLVELLGRTEPGEAEIAIAYLSGPAIRPPPGGPPRAVRALSGRVVGSFHRNRSPHHYG